MRFLMDGLDSCVFSKFLPIKLHVTITINIHSQPMHQTTNQRHCCHCIATCHWVKHVLNFFYRATSLIETPSCASNCDVMIGTASVKTWRCYRFSWVTYDVYGRKSDIKTQCKRDEKRVNKRERSEDSRLVRPVWLNALMFSIKLRSH